MMYPQFSSRNMMSHHASACQAEASFSCAHPACYASDNTIALILDAIILASIFVALSVPVLVLVISVVLVRIILGLALPSRTICHNAMSQT